MKSSNDLCLGQFGYPSTYDSVIFLTCSKDIIKYPQ